MRPLWAVLALLLLPVAPVQGAAPGTLVLEDPMGDLQVVAGDAQQAVPDSRFKALDLVGLGVEETPDAFTFTVQVAGLDQPPEAPGFDDSITTVNFRHNDQEYQTVFLRALGDQSYYWGYLLKYDADGYRNFQRPLDVIADSAQGLLSTTLQRDELLDRAGAAPFPGRTFDSFWAATSLRTHEEFIQVNGVEPGGMYNVEDRMPATGVGQLPFPVRLGLQQSGHAALWSRAPIRASNGEQATFVFNVTAQNSGNQLELFSLSAIDPPADWQVTIPDAFLRIGAGESKHVPVLVSTPFTHTHGVLKKFRLELRSQADPASVGRLDLGVRYFTIPQPGGHHDMLYMHSSQFGSESPLFAPFELGFSGNSGSLYLNTLDADPADALAPITGTFYGYTCPEGCPPALPRVEWRWDVWLQPALELGLDFDLSRAGSLSVPIQAQTPLPQAVLSGRLMHFHYDEAVGDWVETLVAGFEAPPVDLMPNEPKVYTFDVAPLPEADLLPHAKRAFLGLFLNLTSARPGLFTGAEAPAVLPGGTLQLPLFEYRDPLDAAFATMGAIRLQPTSDHERRVNPGKTVLFTAMLTNDLDRERTFGIHISGTHAEWARVLGPAEVTVAGRSSAEIRLAVAVPAAATDRDAADLLLTAQGVQEPELRGMARLVAIVDLGHAHPDDAAAVAAYEAPPDEDSPGPQAAFAALALVALAVLLRRRAT